MFAEVVVPLLIIATCIVACVVMFLVARRRQPTEPSLGEPTDNPAVQAGDA